MGFVQGDVCVSVMGVIYHEWQTRNSKRPAIGTHFPPVTIQRALVLRRHQSPCSSTAERRHMRGLCEQTRAQTCAENAPDQDKEVPWRDHTRPSIPLQHALRYDGCRHHGEKVALLLQYSYHYTAVMYTFTKCYVGFCTPRRMIINSKKKCNDTFLCIAPKCMFSYKWSEGNLRH